MATPGLWLAIKILPRDDRHRICPHNLETPFRLGTVMKSARLFLICVVSMSAYSTPLPQMDGLTLKSLPAKPLVAEGRFQQAISERDLKGRRIVGGLWPDQAGDEKKRRSQNAIKPSCFLVQRISIRRRGREILVRCATLRRALSRGDDAHRIRNLSPLVSRPS